MSFLSAPSEVVNQLILQQLCSSLTLLHHGCFWVSHVPLCKCRCFWSVLSSPTSRLLGRATAQRAEERKGKLRTATANQSPKTTSGKSAGTNPNQTSAVNQSKLLKQRVNWVRNLLMLGVSLCRFEIEFPSSHLHFWLVRADMQNVWYFRYFVLL